MVFPGIIRKVNKTLPSLLQALAVICFVHYVTQGIVTKIHKYNQRPAILPSNSRPSHIGVGKSEGRGAGMGVMRSHSVRPRTTRSTTTTTTTTPSPPPSDEVMEDEQKRRLDVLHKACTRWNIGLWSSEGGGGNITTDEKVLLAKVPRTPLYQTILVSEKHHLAVCPAARTGMQWLGRRLLTLIGKFNEQEVIRLRESPIILAKHNFPFLSSWEKYPIVLAQSITMLMARHPLDRLLASYRFILEDPERNPNGYLHYGRRIVQKYRKRPVRSKGPTFEEFVRYLLEHESRHMEEAWQSIAMHCSPCHIPYNMIVHYETLWHDVQWAWKRAGLEEFNTTDYVVYHLTPETRKEYFSEITLSQILGLYKKYRLDFQMYGYTLEEHIAYAKPGNEAVDPAIMDELTLTNTDHLQNLVKETLEQAKLKKEEEDSIREVLKPPLSQASPSVPLTGERRLSPEINNHIGPVEDYRQPPPQATGT
ncbi:hypothetical protein Pmani_001845 [Petrolisthes manimaculis]|uniref:Carbohydrate sulfotransferase n=1 Tax=Petrolisthes manimaculis TaxID=1843537 RepID=A0AAE1URL6_9EUCA|nr:hypothetical protein Pmani_001845 [Petrolisthes manimaculis]